MATHSCTLAWKIPWTEEPGRLQSMGCKELGRTEQLNFHFQSCYPASLVAEWLKKKKKKNPPANAGDLGSILGMGRYPGERNGNPLQYSCLGNPMDRGAWQVDRT